MSVPSAPSRSAELTRASPHFTFPRVPLTLLFRAANGKQWDMTFTETALAGAFIIDVEPIVDDRGFFAYLFCAKEAAEHGIAARVAQVKLSYNRRKATLRGMHFQVPPAAETKLVRCTRGAIHDVVVDLRPGSPTYLKHFGVELSPTTGGGVSSRPCSRTVIRLDGRRGGELPGRRVLRAAARARLRYDDPRLAIRWPLPVEVISPKDGPGAAGRRRRVGPCDSLLDRAIMLLAWTDSRARVSC